MIDLQIHDRVARITLNRPEKRNALNDEMASKLHDILRELQANPEVRALIIKGAGEAFCAGADLGYLQKLQNNSFEENLADSNSLMQMFKALYHFKGISIAQVEGPALAGGCGLAGLCDFTFASEKAVFGYTEVKIGFIPAIVSVFLGPKIGENKAVEMLLSGKLYNAEESLKMGLINQIINENEIEEFVNTYVSKIIRQTSGQSIAATKNLLRRIKGMSLDQSLLTAAEANAEARGNEDCKRGIASFLNKEKISW